MAYNSYDLANTSLVKTGGLTEMYIPLWWYSSGYLYETATIEAGGSSFVGKGQNTGVPGVTSSYPQTKLHTLNSNWTTTQQFAFEASIYSNNSSFTTFAELYDITSGTTVTSSRVSTTSTTPIILRSGKITLTPGHTYGITVWNTGGNAYLTKASLVAFIGG